MDDSKDTNVCRHRAWATYPFLRAALPNDPDLLAEIHCFSGDEPIFHGPAWASGYMSHLAVEVVRWLQVCYFGRPLVIPRHKHTDFS